MANSPTPGMNTAPLAVAVSAAQLDAVAGKPRVVLILPTYIPESFGGAEQQSRKLALALSRLGLRVNVLAPRLRPATPKSEKDGAISLRRFRLRHAPNLGGRHMGSFILWGAKLLWWLFRHRREYDIIHVIHGRLHAVPAVLAGALLDKPALVKIGRGGTEHFDLDVVNRKRLFGHWYAGMLIRHTTAYVANSREIANDLDRWGVAAGKIYRIPNGVETVPPIERAAAATIHFVYLGRLDPEKAIDLMLRGFARLADRSLVTLSIVGDGNCRQELERLADQLGVLEQVRFEGGRPDVSPILAQADVFVSTSLSEGMSNALLESMSFGVMPLVSRVSGVGEIVEDGRTGLLFAPGDLEAFAAKLAEAVALPTATRTVIGSAARAAVIERFGIEQVAKRHLELYRTFTNRSV